jgi:hypothetical protein
VAFSQTKAFARRAASIIISSLTDFKNSSTAHGGIL